MWRRVHCVGIGGTGISAIARVLAERGVAVSGSDVRISPLARALEGMGVRVFEGHAREHVGEDVELVLVSSAVPESNPEVQEARERGIPVVHREAFWGTLTEGYRVVAVAGTHGKTTTTAMMAWMLSQMGEDPSYVVGGVIGGLGVNAHAGRGEWFVVEADEYDRACWGLTPEVAVVTTLEHDHPDCYPTFESMVEAFRGFLDRVVDGGVVVGCGDEPGVWELLEERSEGEVVLYGLGEGVDVRGRLLGVNAEGGFDLEVEGVRMGLRVPGVHNVRNALAAWTVGRWMGLDRRGMAEALSRYPGTERRFEVRGEVGGVVFVDDYGHHPTEIRATLAAARAKYGDRSLWAVFQPHTYSRLRALLDEFARAFDEADRVVILPVYAAREHDTLGVSAEVLAERMGHPGVYVSKGVEDAAEYVLAHRDAEMVLVTLSAGDGNRVGELVLAALGGEERLNGRKESGASG